METPDPLDILIAEWGPRTYRTPCWAIDRIVMGRVVPGL